VAGGADAAADLFGPGRAAEQRGDIVGELDPGGGGVEDCGRDAGTVQELGPEPLGGITAADLGHVLGVHLVGEGGDFGGFGVGGVVLPEPGVGVGVVLELFGEAQGGALGIDGDGVEPVVSTPMPMIWSGLILRLAAAFRTALTVAMAPAS